MNYGIIDIQGNLLSNLWETTPPDSLTKGQLDLIINEIKRHEKHGPFNGDNDLGSRFLFYETETIGEDVK